MRDETVSAMLTGQPKPGGGDYVSHTDKSVTTGSTTLILLSEREGGSGVFCDEVSEAKGRVSGKP